MGVTAISLVGLMMQANPWAMGMLLPEDLGAEALMEPQTVSSRPQKPITPQNATFNSVSLAATAQARPKNCWSCNTTIKKNWPKFCGKCGQPIIPPQPVKDSYGLNLPAATTTNLTRGYGLNWEPCWNKDGSQIAFTSNRFGNPEICIMNANGTKIKRMTNNSYWDGKPTFGPGELLVYWSDRRGTKELYAWLPSSKEEIAFTEDESPEFDPAFRFDYKFLTYCSYRGGNYQIVVYGIDDQTEAVVTKDNGMNMHPAFCPDGNHIVFSSNRTGNFEIFMMNKDGTEVEQITNNPASDVQPSFHPTGRSFAFISNRDGINQVYSFDIESRDVTLLTQDKTRKSAVMWSPAGDRIVYTAEKSGLLDIHVLKVAVPN